MNNITFPGHELSAQRQKLRLSIDDVYRKLHIPADFIESIETGDLAGIPPMCYAAGFLNTYCVLLDLEPEKYTDLLKDCVRPAPRFLGLPQRDEDQRTTSWMNDLIAWGTICALLILGWVTYSATFQPEAQRNDRQVEAVSRDEIPANSTENF